MRYQEAIEQLKLMPDGEFAIALADLRVPKPLLGLISIGDLAKEGARRLLTDTRDAEEPFEIVGGIKVYK